MDTTFLKLLLNIVLIFTVVKATFTFGQYSIITDMDVGECASASPKDRLPLNVMEPKRYDIKFVVNSNYDSLLGTCKILFHIFETTTTIRLHAYKIQTSLYQIQLGAIDKYTDSVIKHIPIRYRYCKISQIFDLYFEGNIRPGYYNLTLNFFISLRRNEYKDLYHTQYESIKEEKSQRWLFTNIFEPFVARRLFPCWDEQRIISNFNVILMQPVNYTIFSNMLNEMKFLAINNFQWTYLLPSDIVTGYMPASEVKIVMFDKRMGHYTEIEKDIIWFLDKSTEKLRFAVSVIAAVRMSLYKYAEMENITKTLHIMIPNSPMKTAGMHGIVIYRENDVAYLETSDFVGVKLNVEKLIANEIASRWFGNKILSPSWFNMWIIRSFAIYFSYFFSKEPFRREGLDELFVVQILQPTLYYDTVLKMEPVEHENANNDEIDTLLYSRFYYYKGSVFMRMLQYILAPQEFKKRIGQYVTKSAFGTRFDNNFWDTLQGADNTKKRLNPNIKDIMNSWMQQKHYPELYVIFYDDMANITAICENGTNWHIPISFFVQWDVGCVQHTLNTSWLQCNESRIISEFKGAAFIIVNLQQIGYYRVNYENTNWQRITTYLLYKNHTCLPMQNRAQLIDDAYYFAITDKIDTFKFWLLITYLKRETDYVAWYPMFNILSYMSAYLKLQISITVKPILFDILGDLLENIGYEEHRTDDGITKALRLLAAKWYCDLGHKRCRIAASAKWLDKYFYPKTKIFPWWEEWVYCTGMIQLSGRTWLHLFNESKQSLDVSTFKYLACTNEDRLVLYYMDFLMTKKDEIINFMTEEQLTELFRFTLKRHLGKDIVFTHVIKIFKKIANRFYQNDKLIFLWSDVISYVNSRRHLNMILEFSHKVNKKYSPEPNVIKKIIKARWNQLTKILKKFSKF